MQRKSVAFEQLSDLYGFRVIVPQLEDCYRALGIVHTTWPSVPGRFKDYISTPKQNDYRSLHTTVVGPSRQRVELQIRTGEMNRVAEYGIAAHALYKDGENGGRNIVRLTQESRAYAWLRRTIDMLSEGDTPEEFLEHTKLELFHDQVFCFTPKGMLIALPRGGHRHRLRLRRAHRRRQHLRRRQDQRPHHAPRHRARQRRRGRDHPARRRRRRRRRGNRSPSPARRSRRSAAPPARRSAASMAASAATSSSAPSSGPARPFALELLEPALQRLGQPAVVDLLTAVGRGEARSEDVLRAVHPELVGGGQRRRRVAPPAAATAAHHHRAAVDPDPRPQGRPAGALRAERRRAAGRPHRRHPDAGGRG